MNQVPHFPTNIVYECVAKKGVAPRQLSSLNVFRFWMRFTKRAVNQPVVGAHLVKPHAGIYDGSPLPVRPERVLVTLLVLAILGGTSFL